ncbi:hypothetical protein BJ973_002693 [Actinoplanes tereljensis]|uniref:Uncharacterized protein n=1 Tax=Paractinoplanes tereljensis TaxID=571912 RepID=A0A919TU36_9ACTN|nr:hypothetical protein [Actinoplanes tereljensis]GIF22371.1 hypothetical protein Ate02nite_51010 [Actinoplanes tereljensis]
MVDTETGREVPLPAEIAPAAKLDAEVHPVAGNRLLVRITGDRDDTIYLLDKTGKILDREPEALRDAVLLQ